jgi:phosphoglycerate kinase
MALIYVDQLEIKDKKVLARFDFNVPLDSKGNITDDTRIKEALPTLRHILDQGAKKLILMSHLGRPKGGPEAKYSLSPVGDYLARALNEEVLLTESALDAGIKTILNLSKNRIILLENIRFHPEEEKNDAEFSKKLASYADCYVNDAFGTSHRKHASTYGVIAYFGKGKYAGGFLMKKEIQALDKIVNSPNHPFVAILGGAKVSDKIKVIERLLPSVEKLLIGGAMAYPFLKARGYEIGKSLCNEEDVKLAASILSSQKNKIELPLDHVCGTSLEDASGTIVEKIARNQIGLDIGPMTVNHFESYLNNAKTVLWNGPMGLFEKEAYSNGTAAVAKKLASLKGAFTLVGGGDSVAAINKFGLAEKVSHVSTGGGASLEYIEEGTLPGIQALKFGLH